MSSEKNAAMPEFDARSIRIAVTTVAHRDEADTLAAALVERRVAACVNVIGPVNSVYRWQQAIERAEEYLLLMKTDTANLSQLEQAVQELHTYDTPEFLVFEVSAATAAYGNWLLDCLNR